MEENQNSSINEASDVKDSGSGVSFPTIGETKRSGGSKMFLVLGILILVAILGFVIYKTAVQKSADQEQEDQTFEALTTPSTDTSVQLSTPSPTSTATPVKVDKSKVQIQVQNGTGITGDAAYLQTQLGSIGYTNVKVGNSDTTVTATSVTFSSSLDSSVVTEITQKLNAVYETVNSKTSSTATFDVVIVTGLKKGSTAKPVQSASASATPSAKPSVSPSPKPSATP